MINIPKFIRSVGFALEGLKALVVGENNARIHTLATLVVLCVGIWLKLETTDWLWIAAAIALVWILEAINTAIEAVVDLASPEIHPLAKKAKDIMAAAVLIGAVFAIIVGGIILFKYL